MTIDNSGTLVFRYSKRRLLTQAVTGIVIAVLGVLAMNELVRILVEIRLEAIMRALEAGERSFPGDPLWAVLAQIAIIAIVVTGVIRFGLSLYYLVKNDRVFMTIDEDGVCSYKLRFHIIRMPHLRETFIEWGAFLDVNVKRSSVFGTSLVFNKAILSAADPKRTIDVYIKSGEDTADEIADAIKSHRYKR